MGLISPFSGFAVPRVAAITPCEGLGVCQKMATPCWNCPALLKRKQRKTPTRTLAPSLSPIDVMVNVLTSPRKLK